MVGEYEMNTIEIQSFRDVIMFELQRRYNEDRSTILLFSNIWTVCSNAGDNIALGFDPEKDRKVFAREIFRSIDFLIDCHYLRKATKDSGEKILHVALTSEGIEFLSKTIYTGQQKLRRHAL